MDASQGTQKSRHQPPPVLADRSVAPAPGWHPSPGCKWCCCSGRCSLLDFLSWLCYSCRCGSLGLHPVYAVRNVTCAPKPFSFTGDKRSVLRRAVIPAEQSTEHMAGCMCDTKFSVIQMLLPNPLNSAAQPWASSSSAACVRDEFGDAQSRSQGTCAQRRRPTTDY